MRARRRTAVVLPMMMPRSWLLLMAEYGVEGTSVLDGLEDDIVCVSVGDVPVLAP